MPQLLHTGLHIICYDRLVQLDQETSERSSVLSSTEWTFKENVTHGSLITEVCWLFSATFLEFISVSSCLLSTALFQTSAISRLNCRKHLFRFLIRVPWISQHPTLVSWTACQEERTSFTDTGPQWLMGLPVMWDGQTSVWMGSAGWDWESSFKL